MKPIFLGLMLFYSYLLFNDHDTITQMQQNILYNNKRLDDNEIQLRENMSRIQEISNELSDIKGIGKGILALGGLQVLVQVIGMYAKKNKKEEV